MFQAGKGIGFRLTLLHFALVVVLGCLCVHASAIAGEKITIGVIDFAAKRGVRPEMAQVLEDILAEKISRMGEVDVVTRSDIRSVLPLEMRARLAECASDACLLEEIGGALGMCWVVTGDLGRFGESYLINLKLLDIRSAEVPSRVSRTVSGDEEALFDALLESTDDLFEKVADRLPLVPTVTVASRRIQLLEESPSAVTVFTRKEIIASGASDLPDLLRRVPGFDVYRLKPDFPMVGARALTEESNNLVLLLIDGREALFEITGFAFWDSLAIEMEEIERVEVIRGPGSALYGANAFAAVVSVTTIADRPASGSNVLLSAGEYGSYRLFGRLQDLYELGEGVLSYSLGLGTQGMLSPSDIRDAVLEEYRTHGYLRYRRGRWLDLSLQAGMVAAGQGAIYINLGDINVNNALYYFINGRAVVGLGENTKLTSQLYLVSFGSDIHYRAKLMAYDTWLADIPDMYWVSHTLDFQLQLDWQVLENILVIAGTYTRYNMLDWENIIVDDDDELRAAGFVHLEWHPRDSLQITAGLRYDVNTSTESAWSPRAAAVYGPWQDHTFRLGYGLAFRKPSYFESRVHPMVTNFNPATPEVVETLAASLGNPALGNEYVHTFEAGWRARFLDNRLRTFVNLFYSFYRDTILFKVDIPSRLGLPHLADSTVRFENEGTDADAIGGEFEMDGRLTGSLSLWGNLSLRRVINSATGERLPGEPSLRVNLGGRYLPESGPLVDIAFHYVSGYQMPLLDPANLLTNMKLVPLGDNLLMIARLGYRTTLAAQGVIEAGLIINTPLGRPFREYAGTPMPPWLQIDTASDFGGEHLIRLVSLYLRGSL